MSVFSVLQAIFIQSMAISQPPDMMYASKDI